MPYWRLVLASEPDTPGKLKRVAATPMFRKDLVTRTLSGRERDRYFVRVGDGTSFVDAGFVLGSDSVTDSRSLVPADLDGDGDLDLVLRSEGPQKLRLLRNDGPVGPSAELRFLTSRDSDSALVLLESPTGTRKIPVLIGQGFLAQDAPRKLLSLEEGKATSLKVRWPGGDQVSVPDLQPGAIVEVRRFPETKVKVLNRPPPMPLGKDAVERPATCDLEALKTDLPESESELLALLAGSEVPEENKPLLLNFWATWCKPCRKELPLLAAFARKHPEVEVRLVAVDGKPLAIKKMAGRLAKGLSVSRLSNGAVERRGEALRVPSTCFYDPDRRLARGWASPVGKETLEALSPSTASAAETATSAPGLEVQP